MVFKKFLAVMLAGVMAFMCAQTAFAAEGDECLITFEGNAKLLIDGSLVGSGSYHVAKDTVIRFAGENAVAVATDRGYYEADKPIYVTEDMDFGNTQLLALGLKMADGAQVRVGATKLGEGEQLDALADSGLRFIATANYSDTLIAREDVEFGIKITAQGSNEAVYVPAEKFQDKQKTVFSAAVTKLSTNNFNRFYTAQCYAKVTLADGREAEFNEGEVTRSIYQVAVGIMKRDSQEGKENLNSDVNDAIRNILNSYINQVGVRLTYSKSGMTVRDTDTGSYSSEAFFEVTCGEDDVSDGMLVEIRPLGIEDGFANQVKISDWWMEYVRINNNNSQAKAFIRNARFEDGKLTFVFKPVSYTFDQDDSVMVVASLTDDKVTGIKAGEAVEYNLTPDWEARGLAESRDDIVKGCVVLVGVDSNGDCGAMELLATLGDPVNPENFESRYGVYEPCDNSDRYQNVLTHLYSKSGVKITTQNLPDTTKAAYTFKSSAVMCYSVVIDRDGNVTATGKKISSYPSVFPDTSVYHSYLYLRYDKISGKVTQCVFYAVNKNYDFTGGGEYSDIFNLKSDGE